MISVLETLMKKYRDKKIYIWNVNRDSMVTLTLLAFRKIDIQGFITLQEEYAGEMYMNRPVVTLGQIEQEDDVIIIVPDNVPKETVSMLPDGKAVYCSDAMEIDEELRQKRLIIYGIGHGAEKLCKKLAKEGLEADLYCVTKKDAIEEYKGKKVIEAVELEKYEGCAVIISVLSMQYRSEILKTLYGFKGQVYMEFKNIIDSVPLPEVNFMQCLDLAIKRHRKVYLYSQRSSIAEYIEEALHIYGIEITGYVYDVEDKEQNIQSIYDLAYEGVEDKLIIINEEFPERFYYKAYAKGRQLPDGEIPRKFVRARENIELAGFSFEKENYTSFHWYEMASDFLLVRLQNVYDPLLGYSSSYTNDKPGWKVYGKEEDSIRILILGGSTSAAILHPEYWVSRLYYKLKQNNIKVTIYNGAHGGDDIVDEMLRLLRDGAVLRPHIVISMSGVNNLHYKDCANQFNQRIILRWVKSLSPHKEYCSGVHSDESLYSFWNRNVKLLKLISEFYGGRFFGFLQPINITMSQMTLREKSLFESENQIKGSRDFAQSADDDGAYTNLMRLFEHQDGIFIDACHYTDKAHEMIADKVYEVIIPTIQELDQC